jgi:16S rRNA (guanine966-N2)-methyltransferase
MRVIGGALGGRRLEAPPGRATRPTSDRVREALFNVLGDVSDAAVLDLYAGTGALGIEALSRGASRAVFVDNGRPAIAALRSNIEALGLAARSQVLALPVKRALGKLGGAGPFDLVLVDPPYASLDEAAEVLARLAAITAPSARIVLEHASRDAPPEPSPLVRTATRTYGDTALSFYSLAEGTREDVPSTPADG